MSYKDDLLCEACQKGKQIKNSFSSKNIVSTSRPLELWTRHSGKRYRLVIVVNYSRWTWVMFLAHKDKSCSVFFKFCKRVQNEKGVCITSTRSDHGENLRMKNFSCSMKKTTFFIIFQLLEYLNWIG